MPAVITLPSLQEQAERLIALGVADLAQLPRDEVRAAAADDISDALLVIHPDRAPASALAPLLKHDDKAGFIVVDMADVDEFRPIPAHGCP